MSYAGIIASSRLRGDTTSFITTWETTTPDESITIPTTGVGYNYRVDWGDGTVTQGHTGNATHIYAVAGIYTVKISGDFPRIIFNNVGDRLKIKSIEQWGNIVWQSFANSFQGCSNLRIYATDYPDLSSVGTCAAMFNGCSILNPINVIGWDTHSITNMNGMFHSTSFDQNIGQWNVENLTTANNMFLNVTISTANYDATLIGWAALPVLQSGVNFHGGNSKYSPAAVAARNILINDHGWTIVDGGPV